jgi:hypothetical protein
MATTTTVITSKTAAKSHEPLGVKIIGGLVWEQADLDAVFAAGVVGFVRGNRLEERNTLVRNMNEDETTWRLSRQLVDEERGWDIGHVAAAHGFDKVIRVLARH